MLLTWRWNFKTVLWFASTENKDLETKWKHSLIRLLMYFCFNVATHVENSKTPTLCGTHVFYLNSSELLKNIICKEYETLKVHHFNCGSNAVCLLSLLVYCSEFMTFSTNTVNVYWLESLFLNSAFEFLAGDFLLKKGVHLKARWPTLGDNVMSSALHQCDSQEEQDGPM